MEFDAFDGGIKPGGLRSTGEIKILICYLLNGISCAITRSDINEILTSHEIANYFEVNQALSDLVASGNLITDGNAGDESFTITQSGRDAAETLETNLPLNIRRKAVRAAMQLLTRRKREQENHIDIQKLDKGYQVIFTILDQEDELMKLQIYVADRLQAETARENFLNNPVAFYSTVMERLCATETEDSPA